ncbi:MAG: hypothetical protein ACXIT4_09165 [Erythrobacter sp.]
MFAAARVSNSASLGYRYANSPAEKRMALVLSCLVSAALFALLVFISAGKLRDVQEVGERFVLTTIELTKQLPPEPAEEADSASSGSAGNPSKTGQSTAPVTIAPISALPVPVETIRLAPLKVPKASLANEELASTASKDAQSFQAQFARQSEGYGGAGSGIGSDTGSGAGTGDGTGAGAQRRIMFAASWAPSMDFDKGREFYPKAAIEDGIAGVGILRCFVIRRDRVRDCTLVDESPKNLGFGEAALKTAPHLRIRLHDQNGRRVYNEWVTVSNWFDLSEETQQQASVQTNGKAALASNP